MRTCAWAVLALLLWIGASRAESLPAQTPWFPLQKGTTWHYRAGESRYLVRVAEHEKVGEVPCARLEAVRDGKVVGTEHVRVTADGVYRVDLEVRRDDQVLRQTPKPAILLLPLPPRNGQTFTVKSQVNGKEYAGTFKVETQEVKVPAGTYKAVAVDTRNLEAEGLSSDMTVWYAEKVGMVKQFIKVGGQRVEIELEKFEPGK
jgi:hypothetical protein